MNLLHHTTLLIGLSFVFTGCGPTDAQRDLANAKAAVWRPTLKRVQEGMTRAQVLEIVQPVYLKREQHTLPSVFSIPPYQPVVWTESWYLEEDVKIVLHFNPATAPVLARDSGNPLLTKQVNGAFPFIAPGGDANCCSLPPDSIDALLFPDIDPVKWEIAVPGPDNVLATDNIPVLIRHGRRSWIFVWDDSAWR